MERVVRILNAVDRRLRIMEEWLTALMILVIVAVTGIGVFWRYVLRDPLSWPNELALFLFLWIAFLAASLVARDDGHFKIEFFLEKRSARTQEIVNIALNVLKFVFLVVFVVVSIQVFPIQSRRRMTAVIGIHKGWHTFSLTVGFSLMALTVITDTARRFLSLTGRNTHQGEGAEQ